MTLLLFSRRKCICVPCLEHNYMKRKKYNTMFQVLDSNITLCVDTLFDKIDLLACLISHIMETIVTCLSIFSMIFNIPFYLLVMVSSTCSISLSFINRINDFIINVCGHFDNTIATCPMYILSSIVFFILLSV